METQTDIKSLYENSILTIMSFIFKLDGVQIPALQNFILKGNLETGLLAEFDGERFEFDNTVSPSGLTTYKIKVNENGQPIKYSLAKIAKAQGNKIVVKDISKNDNGQIIFNLITLVGEKP